MRAPARSCRFSDGGLARPQMRHWRNLRHPVQLIGSRPSSGPSGRRDSRMAAPAPGSQREIRRRNLSRVLYSVAEHGPSSRASAAARLGLTRTAVSTLVDELLRGGLLTEQGPESSGGGPGRPGTALALTAAAPAGWGPRSRRPLGRVRHRSARTGTRTHPGGIPEPRQQLRGSAQPTGGAGGRSGERRPRGGTAALRPLCGSPRPGRTGDVDRRARPQPRLARHRRRPSTRECGPRREGRHSGRGSRALGEGSRAGGPPAGAHRRQRGQPGGTGGAVAGRRPGTARFRPCLRRGRNRCRRRPRRRTAVRHTRIRG